MKRFHKKVAKLPFLVRQIIGVLLVIGGLFGFLPVLGFWMIPLGILVLSVDFRWARRVYLRMVVVWRRWKGRRRG